MTAWQILISGSALPSGTAWQHLNAQAGSGGENIYVYGELQVELVAQNYDIEMADDYDVELADDLTVELDDEAV